jgi:hypothetical protein
MIEEIPKFLLLTKEQRASVWEKFKPKEVVTAPVKYDPRKPASMTNEEWEKRKEEARLDKERLLAEQEKRRATKKPLEKLDTTGLRWDGRRGKWVKDPFAHLCVPTKPTPAVRPARGSKTPSSFGIPEGTNRDKLAKAMVKRLGEMVTLKEWSKLVYGKENEGPCFNVMGGFIRDLKTRGLRFEIIRDKNEKGQVTFGLFKLD